MKRFNRFWSLGLFLMVGLSISLSAVGCQPVTSEAITTATATATIPVTSPPPTATQPTATLPPPTATITPTASIVRSSQAITITAITMLDPESGWGIGDTSEGSERVLKTADGGNTWRDMTPSEALSNGNQLTKALGYFRNTDQAWVTYFSPQGLAAGPYAVWRTQDGGSTWQASQPLDQSGLEETFSPSHLSFADEDTGWLLVHVGVGMNHDS